MDITFSTYQLGEEWYYTIYLDLYVLEESDSGYPTEEIASANAEACLQRHVQSGD